MAKEMKHLPNSTNIHFSFLTYRNNIVSFGYNNSWKTHPIANRFGYRFNSIHSELACILNYNGNIRDIHSLHLVNVRIGKEINSILNSKPCCKCQKLLSFYGITNISYSTEYGFINV